MPIPEPEDNDACEEDWPRDPISGQRKFGDWIYQEPGESVCFFICVHFWISMRVYVRAGDVLYVYSFVHIHTHEQAQMRVGEFIFLHHESRPAQNPAKTYRPLCV